MVTHFHFVDDTVLTLFSFWRKMVIRFMHVLSILFEALYGLNINSAKSGLTGLKPKNLVLLSYYH